MPPSAAPITLYLQRHDRIQFSSGTLVDRLKELAALLKPHGVGVEYNPQGSDKINVIYLYPLADVENGGRIEEIGWPIYIHPSFDVDIPPIMPDLILDIVRVWINMGDKGNFIDRIEFLISYQYSFNRSKEKTVAAGYCFAYLEFLIPVMRGDGRFKIFLSTARAKALELLEEAVVQEHDWVRDTLQRVQNMLAEA